ncbi:carbon monoxide dehydrogenase, medium subunit [Roseivivax marinus]|uniref:Carbon monoxide dehydrogenase, medium subunit n=1 Tax=Roseivivax marinus TaxID=1379903 RepID=W4HKU9_9RHOB|nr:xanthine dehydrogenase family protein subunit M [Roseivivax marinus]ETW13357.1 carbon monoxide dehydrogenase, medium subunit [Roseivivax marinus]UMA66505.1 xanthine dehydrogenase family protein subunit M [Roseivivax marinus]SEK74941.1 carbon-monoxide dehydrogenase medium subunit [Roseivivax marinus]
MYAFEIERPTSVADAVSALSADEAQPLGGGQTLIPTLKQRLAMPSKLVSLAGIEEMKYVRRDGDVLVIGGGTTHGRIAREAAEHFPGLAALAGKIGDPAVRNRGTIGGSIANNDPSACYPSAAMACGATIVTNSREIAADDYFQGMFTTALEEGEIVTEVRFPIPEKSAYMKFEQIASRFPLVGVFVAKFSDRVGVGVTGASNDGVFRWTEAEEALAGNFSADALSGVTAPPASDMIADLHGTAEYRAHLIPVMTRRGVAAAA